MPRDGGTVAAWALAAAILLLGVPLVTGDHSPVALPDSAAAGSARHLSGGRPPAGSDERLPAKAEADTSGSTVSLAYGLNLLGAGVRFAGTIAGMSFDAGDASTCASADLNSSVLHPLVLTASPTFVCLNADSAGVIQSTWAPDLTNATTYRSGATTVPGCLPQPPATSASTCSFFGSNSYSGFVSHWSLGVPTNTTTIWAPGETGLSPEDEVYAVSLAVNDSTPRSTEYAITVDLKGATPVPQTIYVRTRASGESGGSNLTVLFDETLAWLTSPTGNGSIASVYATVSGFSVNVTYAVPCSTCFLSFTQNGVPAGKQWNVTLSGSTGHATRSSTGQGVVFEEANGTYDYAVGEVSGCTFNRSAGAVSISGADVEVSLNFSQHTCAVSFTESGLATGTGWSVTLGGLTRSTTGSSIVFDVPDGAYAYAVVPVSSYHASPAGGTVSVREGANTTLVRFSHESAGSGAFGLTVTEEIAVAVGLLVVVGVFVSAVALKVRRR